MVTFSPSSLCRPKVIPTRSALLRPVKSAVEKVLAPDIAGIVNETSYKSTNTYAVPKEPTSIM